MLQLFFTGIKKRFLFLFFIVFYSCQGTLDINIYDHAPILTVNCILMPGDSIRAEVSSSQPYLGDASQVMPIPTKDASVIIYQDGNYYEKLEYHEKSVSTNDYQNNYCYYRSSCILSSDTGHIYSIRVSAPGFPEASSEITLPQPTQIISIDTNTVSVKDGNLIIKALECSIKFKDPPGIKNYYKLNIRRFQKFCDNLLFSQVLIMCNDLNVIYYKSAVYDPGSINFFEIQEEPATKGELFIADDTFDGSEYVLKVMIPLPLLDYFPEDLMRKIYFGLYSIGKEYYQYISTYYAQEYKKTNIFSEPIYVYSNIKNGIGIYSGQSRTIDSSLLLPVYHMEGWYCY